MSDKNRKIWFVAINASYKYYLILSNYLYVNWKNFNLLWSQIMVKSLTETAAVEGPESSGFG